MGHFRINWFRKYGEFPNNPYKATGYINKDIFEFFKITNYTFIFETGNYMQSVTSTENFRNIDRKKAEKMIRKAYKEYEKNKRGSSNRS